MAPGGLAPPLQRALVVTAVVFAAALAGVAAAVSGPIALLPLALVLGIPLLFSARWRFAFVVFGGLATLQSSETLTLNKLAYLAGLALSLGVVLCRFRTLERSARYPVFRPVILMFLAFGCLVLLSAVTAISHGVNVTDWLRDASGYLLVAAIPLLAMDVSLSRPERTILAVFVVIGMLTAVAFMIEWLLRHQIIGADAGLQRVVLESFLLPAALFAYASSSALRRRNNRTFWIIVGALTLSMLFVTGTRLSLVLLILPVLTSISMKGSVILRIVRLLAFSVVAVIMALLLIFVVTRFFGANSTKLTDRFTSFNTLVNAPSTDKSYEERVQQSTILIDAFRSSPVWGVGPGYSFTWLDPNGFWQHRATLDSGFAVPGKFGIAGVLVLAAVAAACIAFIRALGRYPEAAVERDALLGYMILLVVWFLFGSPFEDKGTSFGLLCLFSLCLVRIGVSGRLPKQQCCEGGRGSAFWGQEPHGQTHRAMFSRR
jgi:hypothetical protein